MSIDRKEIERIIEGEDIRKIIKDLEAKSEYYEALAKENSSRIVLPSIYRSRREGLDYAIAVLRDVLHD